MKKEKVDVIRAWRDEDYYLSLTEDERGSLPANPSGILGIDDGELHSIAGGAITTIQGQTIACTPCPGKHCAA